MEWSEDLKQQLLTTDPATYGHFPKVTFMSPQIKPISKQSKIAGPAYTVKLVGRDSCAMYQAIEKAPKGSVLVIDRCGDDTYAPVGEFIARNAQAYGLAGIIIDGMATDCLAIEEIGFPVFCKGISPVTSLVWCVSGEFDLPVTCGGATVRPGDIILGDADGVVVLPPNLLKEMLPLALEKTENERLLREKFKDPDFRIPSVENVVKANIPSMITELRQNITNKK